MGYGVGRIKLDGRDDILHGGKRVSRYEANSEAKDDAVGIASSSESGWGSWAVAEAVEAYPAVPTSA
eukprot:6140322-Lingulodinium_polyedra.AAC.1